MFMLNKSTANLLAVDGYDADPVQFSGSGTKKSTRGREEEMKKRRRRRRRGRYEEEEEVKRRRR